ncbi:MAG TPA: hypothetical protein VFV38_17185 [Ktedonobacteraceae bacterium]|nr:hypothetical protein [Ktedonobacteraceae bacterium]
MNSSRAYLSPQEISVESSVPLEIVYRLRAGGQASERDVRRVLRTVNSRLEKPASLSELPVGRSTSLSQLFTLCPGWDEGVSHCGPVCVLRSPQRCVPELPAQPLAGAAPPRLVEQVERTLMLLFSQTLG